MTFKIPTTNAELQVGDVVADTTGAHFVVNEKSATAFQQGWTFVSRPGVWPVTDDDEGVDRTAGQCAGHEQPCFECDKPNTERFVIDAVVGSTAWAYLQALQGEPLLNTSGEKWDPSDLLDMPPHKQEPWTLYVEENPITLTPGTAGYVAYKAWSAQQKKESK